MKPTSRGDLEHLFRRASDPNHVTASGDVFAQGKQGMITALVLTGAGVAATAVVRTGGASGTIIANLASAAGDTRQATFPAGLYFSDGVHVTMGGAGATLDVVGTADAS